MPEVLLAKWDLSLAVVGELSAAAYRRRVTWRYSGKDKPCPCGDDRSFVDCHRIDPDSAEARAYWDRYRDDFDTTGPSSPRATSGGGRRARTTPAHGRATRRDGAGQSRPERSLPVRFGAQGQALHLPGGRVTVLRWTRRGARLCVREYATVDDAARAQAHAAVTSYETLEDVEQVGDGATVLVPIADVRRLQVRADRWRVLVHHPDDRRVVRSVHGSEEAAQSEAARLALLVGARRVRVVAASMAPR